MKGNTNRKAINIVRRSQASVDNHKLVSNGFDIQLHGKIEDFLEQQRLRLKALDKPTLKKIIATAEKSLLSFVKSKPKIHCLRKIENNYQSYSSLPSNHNSSTHQIFDPKKLETQIKKEQSKKKQSLISVNPLVDFTMRHLTANGARKNQKSSKNTDQIKENTFSQVYSPYSFRKKNKKLLYF